MYSVEGTVTFKGLRTIQLKHSIITLYKFSLTDVRHRKLQYTIGTSFAITKQFETGAVLSLGHQQKDLYQLKYKSSGHHHPAYYDLVHTIAHPFKTLHHYEEGREWTES